MKFRIAAGTIVLNQSNTNPMSGEVTGWTDQDMLLVQWCNGLKSEESPTDVTLTGNLVLREIVENNDGWFFKT